MKAADQCKDLNDIREAIDTFDRQIVSLLAQRLSYVLAAAQFKPDLASIPAPARVDQMLTARYRWAVEEGLDPEFVIALFHHIIPWYIATQTAHWQNQPTR